MVTQNLSSSNCGLKREKNSDKFTEMEGRVEEGKREERNRSEVDPKKIVLYPEQKENVERLVYFLEKIGLQISSGETGSGKTILCAEVAKLLNVEEWVVICPTDLTEMWSHMGKISGKPFHVVTFESTERIKKGIKFLAVDEFQMAAARRHRSFSAIRAVSEVLQDEGMVLVLSATPFKSFDSFYDICQRFQLFEGPQAGHDGKICKRTLETIDHQAFLELLRKRFAFSVRGLTEEKKKKFGVDTFTLDDLEEYGPSREDRLLVMYQAVMRLYSSACSRSLPPGMKMTLVNLVYRLSEEEKRQMMPILRDYEAANAIQVKTVRNRIYDALIGYIADITLRILTIVKKSKVIVFVPNNYQALLLEELLSLYQVATLTVTGDVDSHTRIVRRDIFNQPNLLYRVIVLSFKNGCSGISLHDTHGQFPRYLVTHLNDSPYELAQITGRHIRTGMKSSEVGTYVVSADAVSPVSGLELPRVMYAKSKMNKDILNESLSSAVPPEKYPYCYVEADSLLNVAQKIRQIIINREEVAECLLDDEETQIQTQIQEM